MLFLCAYTFLLRVPSEGLALTTGADPTAPLVGRHSCIATVGGVLVLRLAKRKNRPHGSTLRRACTCPNARWLCPVHVLGEWLGRLPIGSQPFTCYSAGTARSTLRDYLGQLAIAEAMAHSLHDFRRGHARDLTSAGGNLRVILEAGEWSSPAFLKYLDTEQVESQVVVQAHIDDSEDDDI